MKKGLIVLSLFAISLVGFGQAKIKIGYTNVDYLLSVMPESKQVETELATYKKQLDAQLQEKVKEFQDKYAAYEKGASMMADVIRADKEKELQNLNEQIETFQVNAEQSLQKKQMTLLDPILVKIQKAIDDVRKEAGYYYILNTGGGMNQSIILSGPEEDNVSNLILKKMGVEPPKEETK